MSLSTFTSSNPTLSTKLKIALFMVFLVRFLIIAPAILSTDGISTVILEPDSQGYTSMGKAFAEGDFLFAGKEAKQSSIIRTPGYPLFLSIYYFFGGNELWVIGAQLMLEVCSAFLLYRIINRLLMNENAAIAGVVIFAIDPLFISFSFKILTESFSLFVFLLANYLFFCSGMNANEHGNYIVQTNRAFQASASIPKKKVHKSLFLSGLVFGFLSLVRPVTLPYAILYAFYMFLRKKSYLEIGLLLLPALLLPSLWTARNVFVLNELQYSLISTVNLVCWNAVYVANDASIDAKWQPFIQKHHLKSFQECQNQGYENIKNAVPEVNTFLLQNPMPLARHYLQGILFVFLPTFPNYILGALGFAEQEISLTNLYLAKGLDVNFFSSLLATRSIYSALLAYTTVFQMLLYFFFIAGAFAYYRNYRKYEKYQEYQKEGEEGKNILVFFVFMLLFFLYNAIAVGPVGNYRYRILMEPFFIMFAAYFLFFISQRK